MASFFEVQTENNKVWVFPPLLGTRYYFVHPADPIAMQTFQTEVIAGDDETAIGDILHMMQLAQQPFDHNDARVVVMAIAEHSKH